MFFVGVTQPLSCFCYEFLAYLKMWTLHDGCDIVFDCRALMRAPTMSPLICLESVLVNHHLCWEPGHFMVGLLVLHLSWSLSRKDSEEITVDQRRKQAKWGPCLSGTIAMPCVKFCISVSRGLQGSTAVIGTIIEVTSEAETTFSLVGFCISPQRPDKIHCATLQVLHSVSTALYILELMEIPQSILWIICMGEIKRIF